MIRTWVETWIWSSGARSEPGSGSWGLPGALLAPSWGLLGPYWRSGTAGWILRGILGGLRCVWLHQVHVSASPVWTQVWTQATQVCTLVRFAAPGARFSVSKVDSGVDSSLPLWTQVWTQVRLAAPGERFSVSRVDSGCLLYTSPSPRDYAASRMPSSA